jgi:deferrochelatase/peroxidase EfeB
VSEPVSRRRFLGGLGVAGAGAGLGSAALAVRASSPAVGSVAASTATSVPTGPAARVDFHGAHQAGIATPAQDRLAFAAFDVTTSDPRELRDLLTDWTRASVAMTRALPVPGDSTSTVAPPADTGEALGLSPAALTVTLGLGPSLFDQRFGLAARRPAALQTLPALPGDALDPTRSSGDLAIQACADDPQVAFHVIRNLARIGSGRVALRWSQLGFGRTSSTTREQVTPRNLMGFKDGTRNLVADDPAAMAQHVWVDAGDQPWMRGGSYLVARRIRMLLEAWDRDPLGHQERVFGRSKSSGAPLTGHTEHDVPDLSAVDAAGQPVIDAQAHIRLAGSEHNGGVALLRRGYSYTDGIDATGLLDAGLFFLSYQRDPAQFITVQRTLGRLDALNEYIEHQGSGVWACPPGLPDDSRTWADHLLG